MARTAQDFLKTFGGDKNGDLSALTDPELQDRLSAYQELGNFSDPYNSDLINLFQKINPGSLQNERVFNTDSFNTEIRRMLAQETHGRGIDLKDETLNQLTDNISKGLTSQQPGDYSTQNFLDTVKRLEPDKFESGFSPGTHQPISAFNESILKNVGSDVISNYRRAIGGFYTDKQKLGSDYSGNIKEIQDMLGARSAKTAADQGLDSLVSQLPGQLSQSTDQFIQGQQDSARRTLEEQIMPEVLAGLNVRGLESSGDLESSLASNAAGLQQQIQSQHLQLQQADDEFYRNAAYQAQLTKSLNSTADVTAQTDYQRNQAQTSQQQNFQSSQSTLNNNLQSTLLQRQQERALAQQEALLRRQRDVAQNSKTGAIVSGIGSSVGSIVGSMYGPAGTVAGGTLGNTLGSFF